MSSIYGRTTTPLTGWYQGAKHALEALSDALRVEVHGSGVKVVLVEPGGFRTNIWEDMESDLERRGDSRYRRADERSLRAAKLAEPLMGDPALVARTVAAAVSSRWPRARYLVGYDAQALNLASRLTPTPVKDAVSRLTLGL